MHGRREGICKKEAVHAPDRNGKLPIISAVVLYHGVAAKGTLSPAKGTLFPAKGTLFPTEGILSLKDRGENHAQL